MDIDFIIAEKHMELLKQLDFSKKEDHPGITIWTGELAIYAGKVIRKGEDLEQEIIDYLKSVPEELMEEAVTIRINDHIEHHLLSYNRRYVDHYMTLVADGREDEEEHKEFLMDMEDEAEDILDYCDDIDAIRTALVELQIVSKEICMRFIEDASRVSITIMQNLYVRPEFAKRWKDYMQQQGVLPEDEWFADPLLIENRPILIPLEEEDIKLEREMEVLEKQGAFKGMTRETAERIHQKLFGTKMTKEHAAAIGL